MEPKPLTNARIVPNGGALAVLRSVLDRDELEIVKVHPPSQFVVVDSAGVKWNVYVERTEVEE